MCRLLIPFLSLFLLAAATPEPLAESETIENPPETIPSEVFDSLALDRGEVSPHNGILIDEATAREMATAMLERNTARTELQLHLELWNSQKQIYENGINDLQDQVNSFVEERAQGSSWWDVWGVTVVAGTSFIVGVAIAVFTVWALRAVEKDTRGN